MLLDQSLPHSPLPPLVGGAGAADVGEAIAAGGAKSVVGRSGVFVDGGGGGGGTLAQTGVAVGGGSVGGTAVGSTGGRVGGGSVGGKVRATVEARAGIRVGANVGGTEVVVAVVGNPAK